jgi:hypothetical protein
MDRHDQRDLELAQPLRRPVPRDKALDVHLANSKLFDVDPRRERRSIAAQDHDPSIPVADELVYPICHQRDHLLAESVVRFRAVHAQPDDRTVALQQHLFHDRQTNRRALIDEDATSAPPARRHSRSGTRMPRAERV